MPIKAAPATATAPAATTALANGRQRHRIGKGAGAGHAAGRRGALELARRLALAALLAAFLGLAHRA
jgi:hypothetical protein